MRNYSGLERRMPLRLLAYWEKLRGDRMMPQEDEIRSEDLPDVWGHCFLVHVRDVLKPDHNYAYLGQAIIDVYNAGLREPDGCAPALPNIETLGINCAGVMDTSRPLIQEGEFTNLKNQRVKYRQCLLPLGATGKVEAIFGGMCCKIFQ